MNEGKNKMKSIYIIKKVKVFKKCEGCKKDIKKGTSCVWISKSWRGISYKFYYHNKKCLEQNGI